MQTGKSESKVLPVRGRLKFLDCPYLRQCSYETGICFSVNDNQLIRCAILNNHCQVVSGQSKFVYKRGLVYNSVSWLAKGMLLYSAGTYEVVTHSRWRSEAIGQLDWGRDYLHLVLCFVR